MSKEIFYTMRVTFKSDGMNTLKNCYMQKMIREDAPDADKVERHMMKITTE